MQYGIAFLFALVLNFSFSQMEAEPYFYHCSVILNDYSSDYKHIDAKYPGGKRALSTVFKRFGSFVDEGDDFPMYENFTICLEIESSGELKNIYWPRNTRPNMVENMHSIFTNMRDWIPAQADGVNRKSTVCLVFTMASIKTYVDQIKTETIDFYEEDVAIPPPPAVVFYEPDNKVAEPRPVEFPDVEATYPGGSVEMMKFLKEEKKYPQVAFENGDQGKVYLSFVVDADGIISNVKVVRRLTPELDREAKRLVRSMPKWIPGELNGKKVKTIYRLPVSFSLE